MRNVIKFTKIRYLMIIISLVTISCGLASYILNNGINMGIDFEAGLKERIKITAPAEKAVVYSEDIRKALADFGGLQVQAIKEGEGRISEFVIRTKIIKSKDGVVENQQKKMSEMIMAGIKSRFPECSVESVETMYIGPSFSARLGKLSWLMFGVTFALILFYIWIRFKLGYAVAAISALVHDVLIIFGFICFTRLEFSIATMAAVLTIVGYSLNDTIVVFDRIRENVGLIKDSDFRVVVNTSITQSLSRTIITSLTTLVAVLPLYIFTTGAIKDFALTMFVGVLVGTYSSIFIASPILMFFARSVWGKKLEKEERKLSPEAVETDGGVVRTGVEKSSDAGVPRVPVMVKKEHRKSIPRKARKRKTR